MSNGAHIELRKGKNGLTLEIGWDEAKVSELARPFCLTKPWEGGSLNRPHSGQWMVWHLKEKRLIAEFTKESDAKEYFHYITKSRR